MRLLAAAMAAVAAFACPVAIERLTSLIARQ
jgi:hypothetical protein